MVWWRDAVVYQIYVRSFADGNGDGIGDIAGIRSRLGYLAGLGVDAVWITPWYPSPQADAGYDVADYRGIEPMYGSLAEAEALIDEAHAHGLRILLDLVPNHTSDQHPWFQAALAAGPGSPERGRYVFRPGRGPDGALPPTNWRTAFGGESAWVRLPDGEWYLHLFAPEQPDLNWEHPEVAAEFQDILRFWFDRGVDGFRIDVANGLVKDPAYPDFEPTDENASPPNWSGHPALDQEGVHDIYRDWRTIADEYDPPRVFVSEAWVTPPERLARYVRPGQLHTTFNFDLLVTGWDATAMRTSITGGLEPLAPHDAPPTWVLSNHDVIRHLTRYGRPAGHHYDAAGTVPSDLALGARRARASLLLVLALPGSLYLYQGEELGLPEVEDIPTEALQDPTWEASGHTVRGRDGCRVPLPWSGDAPPYGWGGLPSWLPQPSGWAGYTVEAEDADAGSMLAHYRSALAARRKHLRPAAAPMGWLDLGPDVLAFDRGPGFVCVVNLGSVPVTLPAHREVLFASGPLDGGALPPDQAVWLST